MVRRVREKRKKKRWRAMLCWRIREEEEGERERKTSGDFDGLSPFCHANPTKFNSNQVFNVFKHLKVY